jgi:hypothetical protein
MATTKSFYGGSMYTRPVGDTTRKMETTYSSAYARTEDGQGVYRERTQTLPDSNNPSIYPQHGNGGYVLPYSRVDSKGFRASYAQPQWVDQYRADKNAYMAEQEKMATMARQQDGNVATGTFSHPSSDLNNPAVPAATQLQGEEQNPSLLRPDGTAGATTAIFTDPLLTDPLANAYRKSRTVYQRSYGKSR